jgi:MFS transporter, PAT family, beta-lactamase induction signal transducer AmpG
MAVQRQTESADAGASRSSWREGFRIYREPRLLAILFMGFSSGLPLPLTLGTLSFWLAESHVSRTAVGLFALVGISYNFKFVWSPLMDRLPLPWLTARLGRRRSWLLVTQILLAGAIVLLGFSDPEAHPLGTAALAVLVAFLSASQDIVIDAYRIELLSPEEQYAGSIATQWGYRFGLIAAGAGALYAAAFGGWRFAYGLMAALMLVGMATAWLTREPRVPTDALPPFGEGTAERVLHWLRDAVWAPLRNFMEHRYWIAILIFIVLYKFGDALAGVMANKLYVELHFTAGEVASISKIFGVFASLAGLALGGALLARVGLYWSLLVAGVLQTLANLMYAALVLSGHDLGMLTASIAVENVTGGMGNAAFVVYLSQLCDLRFTATQYALLSSLAAFGRTVLASTGGWIADKIDWVPFFGLSTVAGFPGLLLLLWLMRQDAVNRSA